MRSTLPLLLVGLLGGCPSSSGGANPPILWLALDGSEIKTRLIDHEPTPF